jgi:hypothetical protein
MTSKRFRDAEEGYISLAVLIIIEQTLDTLGEGSESNVQKVIGKGDAYILRSTSDCT